MRVISYQALHLLIVTILVVSATGVGALLLANSEQYSSLVVMVFMAGTIGGVANNYRRLYLLPTNTRALLDTDSQRLLIIQLYLSPWIGGIFAVVLYGVFAADALQGALFPAFQAGDDPFETAHSFADHMLPATNRDAAKALLWAFIAGFAEYLLPNFIDKIARDNEVRSA